MVDSSESNLNCFEIRHNNKSLMRKHEDKNASGIEAMLRRRKQPKKTLELSSSSTSKMVWTKNNELNILKGILEYENKKGVSYRSDWDIFYYFMNDLIDKNFTKQQLIDKVKKLKKRFRDNHARSINGNHELSFTSFDDEQVFRLSTIIWAKNKTQSVSNETMDQPKDVAREEYEFVNYVRMEKEKSEENELYVLQDALKALFPNLSKSQHKFLCEDLKNNSDQRRKELIDEWKALLNEETKLNIKKQTFSLKLTNGGSST